METGAIGTLGALLLQGTAGLPGLETAELDAESASIFITAADAVAGQLALVGESPAVIAGLAERSRRLKELVVGGDMEYARTHQYSETIELFRSADPKKLNAAAATVRSHFALLTSSVEQARAALGVDPAYQLILKGLDQMLSELGTENTPIFLFEFARDGAEAEKVSQAVLLLALGAARDESSPFSERCAELLDDLKEKKPSFFVLYGLASRLLQDVIARETERASTDALQQTYLMSLREVHEIYFVNNETGRIDL